MDRLGAVVCCLNKDILLQIICLPQSGCNNAAPVVELCIFRLTITIYVIDPSGKLKLSFDSTAKNIIILNHEPHAHTHS